MGCLFCSPSDGVEETPFGGHINVEGTKLVAREFGIEGYVTKREATRTPTLGDLLLDYLMDRLEGASEIEWGSEIDHARRCTVYYVYGVTYGPVKA